MSGGRRRKVLLGVPSASGTVHASHLQLVVELLALADGSEGALSFGVAVESGVSPVELARNFLCEAALSDPEVTELWMIDEDIVVNRSVLSLLQVDADLVSARCLQFLRNEGDPGVLTLGMSVMAGHRVQGREVGEGFAWDCDGVTGLTEVDACGTGCLLVRRRVLEDPRMRVGESGEGDPPVLFRSVRKASGQVRVGEDLDFTWRAKQLGYRVVLDPRARPGHRKPVDLGDVETYVRAHLRAGGRSGGAGT